jgi:protein O-GlcNAc transferase
MNTRSQGRWPATTLLDAALAHQHAGRLEKATQCCASILEQDPGNVYALTLSGTLYAQRGNFSEAIRLLSRSLEIEAGQPFALNSLGNVLNELKRCPEALSCFDRAIMLKPDHAVAHYGRSMTLRNLDRLGEALKSLDTAIDIWPHYARAHHLRAYTLRRLKNYEEAHRSIEKAIELDPSLPEAIGERVLIEMHMCRWSGLPDRHRELFEAVRRGDAASAPFPVLVTGAPLDIAMTCTVQFVRRNCPPRSLPMSATRNGGRTRGRIRIAYLSSDFHCHATSFLMAGVFEQHDRNRFEVFAISFGPDDPGDMRARIERASEHFIDVRNKTDVEVATLLREENVDIAVDLKGHTLNSRQGILAFRPASIQVNYLGFPGTTGAPYIDYILADAITIPEDQRRFYTEKVVYLPDSYQANDDRRLIAPEAPSRADSGLQTDGFVFCSFNGSYKIAPRVFDIWMRLLARTKGSLLWLLESNEAAVRNLRLEASKRGIAAERLVFAQVVPHSDHLARHRLADLSLDTSPCGAHTTASDALWAGLPLLTCMGESFVGRVAASLLHAIGVPEMVTHSLAEYESRALELAHNPSALAAIKAKLARHRKTYPLFDTERFTRQLEDAYERMWQNHLNGKVPAHFAVSKGPTTVM